MVQDGFRCDNFQYTLNYGKNPDLISHKEASRATALSSIHPVKIQFALDSAS
jgi:hypothetical protein